MRTLDIEHLGEALIDEVGVADALYLYDTINHVELPPLEDIPDAAAVKQQGLKSWTIPGTEVTLTQMSEGPRTGEFLFSADAVDQARQYYELVRLMPVRSGTIDVILTWQAAPGLAMPEAIATQIWELPGWAFWLILEQPVWKWLAVTIGTLIAVAAAFLVWRAGRKWDKRRRRRDAGWTVGQPLALFCIYVAVIGLEFYFDRIVLFRGQPGVLAAVALTAARYILVAWLAAVVVAALGDAVVKTFASGRGSLDAALIRLCFRILSITAVLVVLLRAASDLGLSVTPIIAGLGVGGLAVALAIRPTLENIVGGFVLFADKPVRVGEFCSFGDKMGTVEEIGLRSTRLRGLDRTIITVPNAEFAQMQIVNFTRRDMNLYQCSIGLRYETTPEQLRFVAAKIRKLLIQHSKVSPDPARVRFSEFGNSAYILAVFAFVQSADWNEFLAVKEDLNLRIAEIVRDSGTSFAFPSQTVYMTRDPGVDLARGAQAEAEVRQWREEQRLPFPEYDFAEQAEMAGTMPFPPEGSPDYRPAPPPKPPAPADAVARKHHRGLGAWLKGRSQRSST